MSTDSERQVDLYIEDHLIPPVDVFAAALASSARAGLRPINVAPNQGKMLALFARMVGARRILEIGTLGGYSTLWLASALPEGGSLVTLEIDERHAEIARQNLARAPLSCAVEVRVGPALELLPRLADERGAPFDLTFIDADKANMPAYFKWALRLSRVGSVIVADNVIRQGRILDAATPDIHTRGAQALFELVGEEPRVSATAIQTIGAKGHDGFLLALVSEPG